MIAIDNFITVV